MRNLSPWALIVFLFTPALAQRDREDVHLYGGAVVGEEEEYTKGFLGGVGVEGRRLYFGVDGHGLLLDSEAKELLRRAEVATSVYGLDISFGGSLMPPDSSFSIIPVGIIGFTEGEICIEKFCASETQVNAGGGLVFNAQGEEKPAWSPSRGPLHKKLWSGGHRWIGFWVGLALLGVRRKIRGRKSS